MDTTTILIACGIGIIAGWLASLVMKGSGSGLLRNLAIGLLGGIVGHLVVPKTGIVLPAGYAGAIINAFVGAIVLLLIFRLLAK
jgi:uncharacterized membrane protein YeaQ/YmgE (transglycosylase-associated protein family)